MNGSNYNNFQDHENTLKNTARFSDGQISQILASREEYFNFNTETPGFFDCVVNTGR